MIDISKEERYKKANDFWTGSIHTKIDDSNFSRSVTSKFC